MIRNSSLSDCFIAIYDLDDNYITGFENLKELSQFFNMPMYYIRWYLRENYCLKKEGVKYKVYLYKK